MREPVVVKRVCKNCGKTVGCIIGKKQMDGRVFGKVRTCGRCFIWETKLTCTIQQSAQFTNADSFCKQCYHKELLNDIQK